LHRLISASATDEKAKFTFRERGFVIFLLSLKFYTCLNFLTTWIFSIAVGVLAVGVFLVLLSHIPHRQQATETAVRPPSRLPFELFVLIVQTPQQWILRYLSFDFDLGERQRVAIAEPTRCISLPAKIPAISL